MSDTTSSLLHADDVNVNNNKDVEKCYLYNSIIIPITNNKIDDDIITTNKRDNDEDDDDFFFFKQSLWMKAMIISTVGIMLVFAVTCYSSTYTNSFLANNNNRNSNSNNPSSITSSVATATVSTRSRKGVKGCNVASTTYIDAGGRTVDISKPFQLCFQFGNTDSFCWSKSRSVDDGFFDLGTNWEGCYPCGWTPENNLNNYWHGTSERGNNNCGPPCTEFCKPTSAIDKTVKNGQLVVGG